MLAEIGNIQLVTRKAVGEHPMHRCWRYVSLVLGVGFTVRSPVLPTKTINIFKILLRINDNIILLDRTENIHIDFNS